MLLHRGEGKSQQMMKDQYLSFKSKLVTSRKKKDNDILFCTQNDF